MSSIFSNLSALAPAAQGAQKKPSLFAALGNAKPADKPAVAGAASMFAASVEPASNSPASPASPASLSSLSSPASPAPISQLVSLSLANATTLAPNTPNHTPAPLPEVNYFAAPEEVLTQLCARLDAALVASIGSRDVLRELHTYLANNPTLEPLLTPANLASVTAAMLAITEGQHHIASAKAAESSARAEKRAAKAAATGPRLSAAEKAVALFPGLSDLKI